MNGLSKLATGLIAAATLAATAAPAEAGWRDRRWRDRDNDAALAIGAGVVGLAAGLALADGRRDRWDRWDRRGRWDRGWDRRWDRGWRGGWHPRYDARWGGRWGPPGYRSGPGRWDRGVRCWRERVWDDWRGRWRRVRVCG